MSQVALYPSDEPNAMDLESLHTVQDSYPRRKLYIVPLLGIPTLLAAFSWVAGGVTSVTDTAMLVLTGICAIMFVKELLCFSRFWGLGGLVLYGGVIVWFSEDYISHWMFRSHLASDIGMTNSVVAKAAFYLCLFVMFTPLGLDLRWGRWLEKIFFWIPESRNPRSGFILVIIVFLFGISPYFFYTHEGGFLAIYHQIIGGRTGQSAGWLGGRTGNVNYNYSAYLAQVLQAGSLGGIFAILYAVLVSRNILEWIVCGAIWLLWLLLGMGTGTRGEIVEMMMPLVVALFLKYHAVAASKARLISVRAYVLVAILLFISLILIQIQITYRNTGFSDVDMSKVSLTDVQGNSMFSESLMGYQTIPENHNYFYNRYYVEGAIRPIPEFAFWFVIAPMPRALWTGKPIDPVWVWYNHVVTGEENGAEGTTIATGLIGQWYIRYGPIGVIEGAILFGWLIGIGERVFRRCEGRMHLLLFVLGWETWLFRGFRSLGYIDIDGILVGIAALSVFTLFLNVVNGAPETGQAS